LIFRGIVEEVAILGKMVLMQTERYTSYTQIDAGIWNRLAGAECPFLRHEYLLALETSGSACATTGWQPCPILVNDAAGQAVGGVPLWLKSHSFGELVYDFAWAQAYQRAGLAYYPKLIAAIPFSPVTGPRLLIAPKAERAAVSAQLVAATRALAEDSRVSSLHWLFPNESDRSTLESMGYLHRTGVQFHWQNRNYKSFDEFLAGFSADKRKKLKRERRHVVDAGISTKVLTGSQVTTELWDVFYEFYTGNILRHGGMIHLTRGFFHLLGTLLPEAIVLVVAKRGSEIVGSAINLRGPDALYGRYWGGTPGIHSLHFETCYHTPIEYCIANGLQRFEGGAGGEHKLARGFQPVTTHSLHWLRHPQFSSAVADFLKRERYGMEHYIDELNEHVPFRRTVVDGQTP
jgi:predicted N-acyltransferase